LAATSASALAGGFFGFGIGERAIAISLLEQRLVTLERDAGSVTEATLRLVGDRFTSVDW
jgi:hypothetical protein